MKLISGVRVVIEGWNTDVIVGADGEKIPLIDLRGEDGRDVPADVLVVPHPFTGIPMAVVLRPARNPRARPGYVFYLGTKQVKYNSRLEIWAEDPVFCQTGSLRSSNTGRHRDVAVAVLARAVTRGDGGSSVDRHSPISTREGLTRPVSVPDYSSWGDGGLRPHFLEEGLLGISWVKPLVLPNSRGEAYVEETDSVCAETYSGDASILCQIVPWVRPSVRTIPVRTVNVLRNAANNQSNRVRDAGSGPAWGDGMSAAFSRTQWGSSAYRSVQKCSTEIVLGDTRIITGCSTGQGESPAQFLVRVLRARLAYWEAPKEHVEGVLELERMFAETSDRVGDAVEKLRAEAENETPQGRYAGILANYLSTLIFVDPRLARNALDKALEPPEYVPAVPPPAVRTGPAVEKSSIDISALFGGNAHKKR